MRNLNDYDVIFCDIDNTLVYGFFTRLMDRTWSLFHSNIIADVLMFLQEITKIYKINQKLKYKLMNTKTKLVFLTARREHPATAKLLVDILEHHKDFALYNLATDNPAFDKCNIIMKILKGDEKAIVFDDNETTLRFCRDLELDVFDVSEDNVKDVIVE